MIPEKLFKKFVEWSVDEVYDKWELFALEASIFAYEVAIIKAREESDARVAQMKQYIESLVEFHELVIEGKAKDHLVYTPILEDWK